MARLLPVFITYNDDNGDPLSGGKLQFNVSGSASLAKDTFSDEALTVANPNPIVLDSAGRVPDTVIDVFGAGDYRLIVKNSADVAQETFDPLAGAGVRTVDDYAALQALANADVAEDDGFYVKFRSTAGDGGHGHFTATLSSPGADNDGTILHSDTGARFFERSFSGEVNVLWFGADSTGAASSATAFTNARGTGKNIYAPRGTYDMGTTEQGSLVAGQYIVGDGEQVTILTPSASSIVPVISALNVDDCGMRNLTLDYSLATGGTASVANFNNCDDVVIEHVEVIGSNDKGINLLNCARHNVHHITGDDCDSWMVAFDGAAGIGGRASNISSRGTNNRVVVARDQSSFIYSDFSGVDCGGETFACITSNKGNVSNVLAVGNTAGDGVSFDGCTEITGGNLSAIDHFGHGISVGSGIGTASSDIQLSGVQATGGDESGVAITDNGSGVDNIRISITGILVKDPGQGTTNTFSGITLQAAQDCHVEGDVYDVAGNMNYGLRELDGAGTSANNTAEVRIHNAGQTGNISVVSSTTQVCQLNLEGLAAVGDAAKTWFAGADQQTQLFNTTLTANRVITLKTGINAYKGAEVIVKRAATGAFSLAITPDGASTLKTLVPGDWARCVHDGANWQIIEFGSDVGAGSTITIASGEATVTEPYHLVAAEGAPASDILDTLNGNFRVGQILILAAADGGDTITITDGVGNINTSDVGSFVLDNTNDKWTAMWTGSEWHELSRSNNGA